MVPIRHAFLLIALLIPLTGIAQNGNPGGGNGNPNAPGQTGETGPSANQLTILGVEIVYLGDPDVYGIPALLDPPVAIVVGDNFGDEALLEVDLAGFAVTIDVETDAAALDNLVSFDIPADLIDPTTGDLIDGEYLLKISNGGVADADNASFSLTVDATASRGTRALIDEANLRIAGDDAEVFARTQADSELTTLVDTAQTTADDAALAADAAQTDATQGLADAAAAQAGADNAQTDATQALTEAANAQTAADDAQTDATQGVADAATAQTAADAAQTDATQALADAASAQTAADDAQADATQGLTDAASAQTAASNAQTDATQGLTDAATAQTAASNAQTDATQALAGAGIAQTTADAAVNNAATAQAAADNAQNDATSAQTAAEQAQSDATSAINNAASAQATADTAQSTADLAASKSELDAVNLVATSAVTQSQLAGALSGDKINVIPDPVVCGAGTCQGETQYLNLENGKTATSSTSATDIYAFKRDVEESTRFIDTVRVFLSDGSQWSKTSKQYKNVSENDASSASWSVSTDQHFFDGAGIRANGRLCGQDEDISCSDGALLIRTSRGNLYKIGQFTDIDNDSPHADFTPQDIGFRFALLGSINQDGQFLSATIPSSESDGIVLAAASAANVAASTAQQTADTAQNDAAIAQATAEEAREYFLGNTTEPLLSPRQLCKLYRQTFSPEGNVQNVHATDACRAEFDWNSAPVARADTFIFGTAAHKEFNLGANLSKSAPGVLENDSDDPDGDAITLIRVSNANKGSIVLTQTGAFRYIPDPAVTSNKDSDQFTYKLTDENGNGLWAGKESATVTVDIKISNRAPVAVDDEYTLETWDTDVCEGDDCVFDVSRLNGVIKGNEGAAEDTDADLDELRASKIDDVDHGTLSLGPNGHFTYTPNPFFVASDSGGSAGEDSFRYRIADGYGGHDTARATIKIRRDRIVFVTPAVYKADFGGLSGADQACQGRANNANLPGNYMAWLSDRDSSVRNRFDDEDKNYRYILKNGDIVAGDWPELISGNLRTSINRTASGGTASGENEVWTGTLTDGRSATNQDGGFCDNWNKTNGAVNPVAIGRMDKSGPAWTDATTRVLDCDKQRRLYCVQK